VNKQELVEAVAERLGVTRGRAGEVIDALFGAEGVIGKELRRGGKVAIAGFGTFEPRKRAARAGRNPRTGNVINLKPSTVPAFRAGKGLKALVNSRR
jgi:DNA-binding protein HU-beta